MAFRRAIAPSRSNAARVAAIRAVARRHAPSAAMSKPRTSNCPGRARGYCAATGSGRQQGKAGPEQETEGPARRPAPRGLPVALSRPAVGHSFPHWRLTNLGRHPTRSSTRTPRGTVATETLQTQEAQVMLFDKCRQFTQAREIQAAGLYPYFKPISESEDTVVIIDGQKRIMLGSNNYLGLTHHPKVLEAASKALHRYGSGCTGSRFLNGSLDLHEQLETAAGRVPRQGSGAGLLDRLRREPRPDLGPARPRRDRLPRQARPRLHRGRRQALVRRDAALQPRRPRPPDPPARAQHRPARAR